MFVTKLFVYVLFKLKLMKYVRASCPFLALAGALFVFAAVIAWQPDTSKAKSQKTVYNRDTTIPKSAGADQIDIQLNLDSVMQQVNVALSKIDYAKMNADVQKAMAQVDYNKINLEVNKAMKDIDWAKMKTDVSVALDSAKMAINNINWNEIKANIDHAQAEAKKAIAAQKLNTAEIQKQVQKSLQDAQKSLQAAQKEMQNYKALKAALEKDGLIEVNKPYRIQLKDGMLYVNGVKQSKATTDKYNRYYPNKKNFNIGDDGGTDL